MTALVAKQVDRKTRTALPGRFRTQESAQPGTEETRKTLVELTCGRWNDMAPSLPASVKEAGSANILNTVQESKRKGKH